MTHWVWLLLLLHVDDNRFQPYRDSLFIYNIYKDEVDTLAKAHDYLAWRQREYIDAAMTEKAFERLAQFNGVPYEPVEVLNREGFGTAYRYPKPSDPEAVKGDADIDSSGIKFSVTLPQTRFITDLNGMTRIPFIIRVYFDQNGEQRYVELLDPSTCELLK